MDDMLKFLAVRIEEDRRAAADTGAVGSHLRLLGSVERLADDFGRFPDPWDGRTHGMLYALRVLAQTYAAHPDYQAEEWHP